MTKWPKLYIGPMSINIVDAVTDFCKTNGDIFLGFCASRRQVEFDGGYVNNWTTESFANYIGQRAIVVRDHGGPKQGATEDDGFESFGYDASLVDVIHIDPWKRFRDIGEAIEKTAEYIRFCYNINQYCLYEVGTEEAIRRYTHSELEDFLGGLKKELGEEFGKVVYAVIQSGTSLQEDSNTGTYDRKRLEDMIGVCKKFGLLSKEHNGDYLSSKIIKEKFSLGLDSINIAPEFGVIETKCVLGRITNDDVFEKIYKLCYDSGKWQKWVGKDFDPESNKYQLVKLCGHYIFSHSGFKDLMAKPEFELIEEEVKEKVKERIGDIVLERI